MIHCNETGVRRYIFMGNLPFILPVFLPQFLIQNKGENDDFEPN